MLVGLHEGFLQNILGILAILGDVLRQPEDLAFVPSHQFPKGAGIAIPGLRDQRALFDRWLGWKRS